MAIINFNSISGVSTVTATSSVTVGDTFIKDKFVGLGTITTTARNAGVGTAVGSLIYNETVGEVQIYKRNSGWVSIGSTTDPAPSLSGLTATGGVISDYSTPPGVIYRAHIFTSSGAFSVSALSSTLPNNVDIFAIGGGGGGSGGFPGYGPGRGGGAGGAFVATLYPVSVNTYPISVGAGGVGAKTGPVSTPFASGRGSSGGNSTFTNPSPQVLTAAGGGGGGDYDAPSAVAPVSTGGPGGCGGGGGGYPGAPAPNIAGGTATQPSQNPGVSNLTNYGFAGGTGDNTTAGGGGAGGGTGGIGDNYGPPTNTLRAGGPGIPITYAYGPTTPETYGVGGPTGGPNTGPTVNATYSTGNGGMGWLTNPSPSKGGNGGSGIVVVRYQIGSLTATAKATGGAISYYGGKTIHTFTSSGFFENTSGSPLTVDQIIVAGGGGGGGQRGGGGGAGGVRTSIPGLMPATADSQTVVSPGSPNKITVTIGGGGSGGVAPGSNPGVSGSPSVFGPLTATGGGYGGGDAPALPGATGGSSGGSAAWNDSTSAINSSPNTDSTRQGYPSGSNAGLNGPRYGAGGGGGAGGAGGNGTTTAAGYGGVGVQLPSAFRDPAQVIGAPGPNGGGYWIAGGGGGGIYNPGGNPAGKGGGPGGPYAGGGNGGDENTTGSSGISNTGAGGGGGWNGDNPPARFGGSGGSGLVLVIYPS